MKNSPKNFYNVVDKKKLGIDEVVAVTGEVEQLKTTVGDSSSGLVKQVNDLQTTVDNIDYDISRKADIDGSYPDMTVGNADQLNSTQMITDKVPYVFRTSGGSIDIGNREHDQLVGGSIVWNQKINTPAFSDGQGLTFENGTNGYVKITGTTTSASRRSFISGLNTSHVYMMSISSDFPEGFSWTYDYNASRRGRRTLTKPSANLYYISFQNGIAIDTAWETYINCYDLTQMFGSVVADAVYALETATPGAGLSFIDSYFPKSHYDYNAGQLMSVKTIAHKMVGFNQWDEEWELGAYDNNGEKVENNNVIRSKNVIPIIPGISYYFKAPVTSPALTIRLVQYDANMNCLSSVGALGINRILTLNSDCRYIAFNMATSYGTTYNNDICINLSWTGYRNGEYEPYVKYSYVLDQDLELRGLAKVDNSGNIYYDGDTYSSDGTVIRNYEIRAYASGDESLPDAITDGTNTVVKLVTPVEESADPFQDPQWVDDFGTEEYVDTRDIKIPVGHITQYPANLRDKLQHLPSPTGVNGDYIIREDTEVMTLVPAPTGVPELPSVDGTYVLTCTVSDGTATLSWTSNS